MTQIKKTLSIAGIIALATAPAMAEIASTDYVQSIVNNMIPKSGTVGHVLKKTATGLEWAAAPTPTLETTTGQSTTATMTQKAITDALDKKIENVAKTEGSLIIGTDAKDARDVVVIGPRAFVPGREEEDEIWADYAVAIGAEAQVGLDEAIAIGHKANASDSYSIAIGSGAYGGHTAAIAIGDGATTSDDGYAAGEIAIGDGAKALGVGSIQLGSGTNNEDNTFQVFGYQLLDANGKIPAERLTNAPAPSLESILPTAPNNCKNSDGQQCALVMTWSSSQNKFTYSWEVVKVSE